MSSPSRTRRRRALRKAATCPDCDATVRTASESGAVTWLEVRHDDTCPWWRSHGAAPFKQMKLVSW